MLEQEIKNIWKNSAQTSEISIETNLLVEELNAKMKGILKTIRIRDIREISASVIGTLFFGYLLYEIPFPITKAASVFAIIWFVLVIFKFRKSKPLNGSTKLSLSMTEQLEYQEANMSRQADLLDSATYWYAIPPFIMNFLFILGLGNPSDYNWANSIAESILPFTINLKIVILTGLALFYAFIIWVNKRAVNKDVKPLLESIRSLQGQLKNE